MSHEQTQQETKRPPHQGTIGEPVQLPVRILWSSISREFRSDENEDTFRVPRWFKFMGV